MTDGPARQAAIAAALAVLHLAEAKKGATRQERLAEATAIVAKAIALASPVPPPRLAIEPSVN